MNIRLKKKSMRHGVPLPKTRLSATSPIEPAPLSDMVILPLQQGVGAPSKALVKKGDRVLTGQKIADSAEDSSVPVHATIHGEVANVTTAVNPSTGEVMKTIIITLDGADKSVELQPTQNIEALTIEEILKKIREAGIVSIGNASTPTHVKLAVLQDKKVDTLLLNGCDSELYVSANHRVILEYGQKVLSGLNIIKRILSPDNVYIAMEDGREDAIEHLEKLIAETGYDFKIVPIKVRYPVAEEKILIKTVLDREVPVGGVPSDVGVAVFDVNAAKAIHEAIHEGKPFIDRVVTVTGAVKNPKNLLVRFGTPIKNLIDYCGGITEKNSQVIAGGPVTGTAQFHLDSPLANGTNCVLVKAVRPIKVMECMNCGRCVEACPMGLMPCYYPKYVKAGRYSDCQKNYISNCTECGACAYMCPSHIPVVEYIKIAKRELSRRVK